MLKKGGTLCTESSSCKDKKKLTKQEIVAKVRKLVVLNNVHSLNKKGFHCLWQALKKTFCDLLCLKQVFFVRCLSAKSFACSFKRENMVFLVCEKKKSKFDCIYLFSSLRNNELCIMLAAVAIHEFSGF